MKPELTAVLFFCSLIVACKPQSSAPKELRFSPMQNGFGVVAQWVGVDSGPGAELYYKGTNETPVRVWPYIGTRGYPILYSNDVALLLADKPDAEGRLVISALIAVLREGPAMDISSDLLRLYAVRTNADFNMMLRNGYHPLRLQQNDADISVTYLPDFESRITTDLKFQITWEQVFSIMEDVKRTGKTNKCINTDVLYLQKDYSGTPK